MGWISAGRGMAVVCRGLAVILVTKDHQDHDSTRTFEERRSRLYWLPSPCYKGTRATLLLTDKFQNAGHRRCGQTCVFLLSLTSRGLCRWIFGPGPKRIIRYRYRRFCVVEGCRCCRLLLEIFHVSSPWPLPFRTRESAVQRYFRRLD